MSFSVYELYDLYGNVVWVGETRRPKGRLWQHTSKTGRFTGHTLSMHIIAQYQDRKDAWDHQIQLQKEYGLITDNEKKALGGFACKGSPKPKLSVEHKLKIGASLKGKKRNQKPFEDRTCPHCNLVGKGANMTRYHFDNCKKR